MANKIEFNVLVSGMDKFSEQLNNGSESLESFRKFAQNLGRELDHVAVIVSAVGASMSGPLLLAFKNSAKSSAEVNDQLSRLSQITNDFQKELSTAMVPVFERFVNIVDDLFKAFNSLDEGLRNQIVQGVLLTGVFLTLAGLFTIIIGKTLVLAANLAGLAAKLLAFAAVNPILLGVSVALVVIVTLMFKFKEVADIVFNTFQILFLSLQTGFLVVKSAVQNFVAASLDAVSVVIGALGNIPGPMQEEFAATAVLLQNNATLARNFAEKDLQAAADKTREISNIITTGQGSWSIGFQDLKQQVMDFFSTLGQGGGIGSPVQGFIDGFKEGIDQIGVKISDLRQAGIGFANAMQTNLSQAFSDIILGAKTAKEAFAAFGAAMLKSLVDFVAQWISFQIISKVFMAAAQAFGIALGATLAAAWAPAAAMVSLATFGGNAAPAAAALTSTAALSQVLAIPKFAQGSGGIKDDTFGLFNKGEIVVPNRFSDAIRSGDLSLSGGGSSQGSGVSFDFTGAQFNGITDTLVRDIFTRASENIKNRTLAALPA